MIRACRILCLNGTLRCCLLGVVAVLHLYPTVSLAQSQADRVRGAFVLKFFRYLDWAVKQRGYRICFLANNPFGEEFTQAASKEFSESPVTIDVLGDESGLKNCDVLYLSSGQEIELANRFGLVIITDGAAGGTRGHINFEMSEGRVRFRIDVHRLREVGVSVSSKLMRVSLQ